MSKSKPKSAMAAFMDKKLNMNEVSQEGAQDSTVIIPVRDEVFESHKVRDLISDSQQKDSVEIITVHPSECTPWKYADRQQSEMGDIDSLASSMKKYGQQQPILIRKNTTSSNHKYEVIFGNRRWRAAHNAEMKLSAVKKDISDQDAGLVQKHENENRAEVSDYSRALNYKSLIDGKVFESEKDLSQYLGMSKQTMNDIMAYLRVPNVLRERIDSYSSLSKNMVSRLATLSKDKEKLNILIQLAPDISSHKVTTTNLDRMILNHLRKDLPTPEAIKLFKNDSKGRLMYEIQQKTSGKVNVIISKQQTHDLNLELLNTKLMDLIDSCKIK